MCIDTVKLNKFLPSSSSYCMIHQVFRRRVKLNDCNGTFLASPHGNGALYSFPGTFALTSESRWAIQKAGKIEDFCNFLSWFVSCVRLGSTTSGRSVSDIFHPLSSSKVKVQGMENLKWETCCWYMIPHRQSTIGDGSLTSIRVNSRYCETNVIAPQTSSNIKGTSTLVLFSTLTISKKVVQFKQESCWKH